MTTEPLQGEIIENEHDEPRAITVRETQALVDVDKALAEWEAYQQLTRRLLNDDDYQQIGKRRFKKKSAWRKYARAFNVSCEIVREEIVRQDDGFPTFARLVVRAVDPSGRYQDGDQECHIRERCCAKPCSKASWRDHACCAADCSGRIHWSHPGDLVSTAFTRAKNRAIADLIGAGEVSAEEMTDEAPVAKAAPPKRAPRPEPAPPVAEERKSDPRVVPGALQKAVDGKMVAQDWDENALAKWLVDGGFQQAVVVSGGQASVELDRLPESKHADLIAACQEPATA